MFRRACDQLAELKENKGHESFLLVHDAALRHPQQMDRPFYDATLLAKANVSFTYSAGLLLLLLTQPAPHQQGVFVRIAEHQAVERVLVRAQRVHGGAAVVHNTVQQAEFRGRTTNVAHANVDTDI